MNLLEKPSKPKRDRATSMKALVDAAEIEFSLRGFAGATTRAIAERAGRSEGLIQDYFGGKAGLFFAVHELGTSLTDRLVAAVDQPESDTLAGELGRIIPAVCHALRLRIHHLRLVYQQVLADRSFAEAFKKVATRAILFKAIEERLATRWRLTVEPCVATDLILTYVFDLAFVYPELQLRSEKEIEEATRAACLVLGAGLDATVHRS